MQKGYYAIIPANVRYDKDLNSNAKLLYGELTALCNEKGYCWASNNYFAELYGVSDRTIRRWISNLADKGYVRLNLIYHGKEVKERHIYINQLPMDKNVQPLGQKCPEVGTKVSGGRDKSVLYNNTLNNTLNNKPNTIVVKDDNAPRQEENKIPYKQIVEYLNLRTGKKFKHSTRSTKDNIKARWNEGFRLEDFKKVIDVKTSQWINNPNMKQYLRPVTLFSNKFESYLNEEVKVNGKVSVGQYGGNQATREDAWTEHEAQRAREYVERIGGKELDCDF